MCSKIVYGTPNIKQEKYIFIFLPLLNLAGSDWNSYGWSKFIHIGKMKTTTATEELGVMTKKNLLTHVHITAVYAFVRIYLTVHLRVEHFTICGFDLPSNK